MIGWLRNKKLRLSLAAVLAGALAGGTFLVSTSQVSAIKGAPSGPVSTPQSSATEGGSTGPGSTPQVNTIEGGYTSPPMATDMAQIWQKAHPDFPGQDQFRCSGVVTSGARILTASHCFHESFAEYYVRFGTTELGKGDRREIARGESRGDLTVLAIETRMEIGVPYAELAPNEKVPMKTSLASQGWGRTCATCGPSPPLKSADTVVNDNHEALSDLHGGPAYRVAVRRSDTGRYTALHPGDSGGPSWSTFDGDTRVVYGVASKVIDTWAYMSATYDVPGRPPVHDWLRLFGQMKVAEPGGTAAGEVVPNGMPGEGTPPIEDEVIPNGIPGEGTPPIEDGVMSSRTPGA